MFVVLRMMTGGVVLAASGLGRNQFVIARGSQPQIFLIEMDTGPGIGGGILFLLVVEHIGLPIGELLVLADTQSEEIGIEFLQTQIFNAQTLHAILDVDEGTGLEIAEFVQHVQIIVERQSHLGHRLVFQEADDGRSHTDMVEPEEKTDLFGSHLQQRHLVECAAFERGTRLRIDAEEGV